MKKTIILILLLAVMGQAQPWKSGRRITRIQVMDYVTSQTPNFKLSISRDAHARTKGMEFFVKYGSDRTFNNYKIIAWGYVSGKNLKLIIPNALGIYRTYKSRRDVRRLPGDTVLLLKRDGYEGDWVRLAVK